jgi:tetratricopeptide (TPR) repeat protein
MYFRGKQNFQGFSAAVSTLLAKDAQKLAPEVLNGYAWEIFENCNDQKCILEAIKWSQKSLVGNNDPMFIDTYANLLHKSGDTKEAIVWQKKAIEIMKEQGEDTESYEETLGKMEKGEKTWN